MTTRPRPRCRYLMLYLGRKYCKEVWKRDMMSEAKEIPQGCPRDCQNYEAAYPTIWDDRDPGVDPGTEGA